ncbi:MAG: hypothetical protein ACFHU9_13430 [Fluviicola sp.]
MKAKLSWKKIVLEALMIVLSVLLALFINEWNNNRKEAEVTEVMMKNITIELESNQELVAQLIPYHKAVFERIQAAVAGDSLASVFLGNGYFDLSAVAPKGIKQGEFQNIAWTIAKEDRISNRIPYDKSQALFFAYEQQARVENTIHRIIDILGSREIHREELLEESIITLALEWNEMMSQEEELYHRYSAALKELRQK